MKKSELKNNLKYNEDLDDISDIVEIDEDEDDEIEIEETEEIEEIPFDNSESLSKDLNIAKIFELTTIDQEKSKWLKNDTVLKDEILERLLSLTKKEFFMSVINTNTAINKKFSYKQIQETRDIDAFLKDYNILNGFYRFLPTFIDKRIPELNENVEACGEIIKEVTEDYIPLIKNIIGTNFLKKHAFISNNFNELFAGGINGLIVAMYKFDPSKKVKFITHAYRWIIYYIYREMDDIVKVYNEKLCDDDSFFDSLADEDFEDNMIKTIEIDKIINVDMLDNYERGLVMDALQEKIKMEDLDYTLLKIQSIIGKDVKNIADYIRA